MTFKTNRTGIARNRGKSTLGPEKSNARSKTGGEKYTPNTKHQTVTVKQSTSNFEHPTWNTQHPPSSSSSSSTIASLPINIALLKQSQDPKWAAWVPSAWTCSPWLQTWWRPRPTWSSATWPAATAIPLQWRCFWWSTPRQGFSP